MSRRVVVTGVGLVSPLGVGTGANWEALCAGRNGIGPITHFDPAQFSARIAGEVKDFAPLQFMDKKDVKKMDVFIQFAIAASQFAVDDARLTVSPEIATRVGVFIASGIGGFSTIEREHKALLEGGPRRISPFFIPAAIINLAAGQNRDGFIMGEGSGVVILEELEFARRRGAPIYAELVGYGMSADAYHITAPSEDGDGGVRVMQAALRQAAVQPDQVNYINAHGTSTPYNDKLETLAIKRLFGEHARALAISSTKSMTGHLLGAAGGLEAGITVLAIKHQMIPPTINYETPDPECDLDYVPNTKREAKIEYALSNSFGFGGTNGALLFKRYGE
ncbi:MAG: beta-ketoacyl-[acyl-carrier-protein] synthase II [Acidobacteria bacterium]|nr:beta-ketoacyl-[acyl-carrier-protein] synthase II [Acidobacteriota bacterium]